jgi:hypothetical protein
MLVSASWPATRLCCGINWLYGFMELPFMPNIEAVIDIPEPEA